MLPPSGLKRAANTIGSVPARQIAICSQLLRLEELTGVNVTHMEAWTRVRDGLR